MIYSKTIFISMMFPFLLLLSYCANDMTSEVEQAEVTMPVFNVKDYGATGDSITDDTQAINRTIEVCDSAGGGRVYFPAGVYMISTIALISDITIHIDTDALVKSNENGFDLWEENQFDEDVMDRAYYHINASMFRGENLSNIKFKGKGTIDAGGLTKSSKVKPGEGDKVIALRNCKNIEITGLNFAHNGEGGAHYVILLTGCDGVRIDSLNIKAKRDGINLMNSRNVDIVNTQINSVRYEGSQEAGGDDAIKIGSDYSLGEIRSSYNINVKNCTISAGCNGIMFGTETLGPISNCTFEDIEINFSGKNGLGITSNDGSIIDGLTFKNITMKRVLSPFFIKVSDVKRVPSDQTYSTGKISNIVFENIKASDISNPIRGEMTNVIWGKPNSMIENVEFTNVDIMVKGGHPLSASQINPPENDERFPKKIVDRVIHAPFPSYGYYLRHVKGINFNSCNVGFENNDDRPSYIIDDGDKIKLNSVVIQKGNGAESYLEIRNTVKDFMINNCPGLPNVNETIANKKY